jgi:hypothetical protein
MAELFFKSPGHKQRWLAAMQEIGKIDKDGSLDPEYGACLYILSCNTTVWEETRGDYVSRDGIDFETMFEEVDFSGGYSVLIKLAANLFNDRTACSPVDLMKLDESNFKVAMTAFGIRRYSFHEDDFK